MKETEAQLIEFFNKAGASKDRSLILARQMIKRAAQLSKERGFSEEEAMKYLLKLFVEAQQN
jgi:hypothetical protein